MNKELEYLTRNFPEAKNILTEDNKLILCSSQEDNLNQIYNHIYHTTQNPQLNTICDQLQTLIKLQIFTFETIVSLINKQNEEIEHIKTQTESIIDSETQLEILIKTSSIKLYKEILNLQNPEIDCQDTKQLLNLALDRLSESKIIISNIIKTQTQLDSAIRELVLVTKSL